MSLRNACQYCKRKNGILLSLGPGDPTRLAYLKETVTQLLGEIPIIGICLSRQIIARALGADMFELKFGHRGGNHPVRDLTTGRVHITAQNHSYAMDINSLKDRLEVSNINLKDGTVEGITHKKLPIASI